MTDFKYPPVLSMADYMEVIDLFCQDNRKAKAIYTIGTINDPGISDIDFLVVDAVPKISPKVREYLVGGNVLVMPESMMKYINYLERFDLQQVWGDELEIEKNENELFDAIEIIEWLPERICLLEHLKSVHDIRRTLLYLKSMDLSIRNVEKYLNIAFPRISNEEIRSNYRALSNVVGEYIRVAHQAWEMFEERTNFFTGEVDGSVNFSNYYTFTNRFPLLMQYLCYITSIQCSFSRRLRRFAQLKGYLSFNDWDLECLISFRVGLMNELYQWFVKENLKSGMIKYGWIL